MFFWQSCQTALNVPSSRPYEEPSPPGNRFAGEPPRKRTGFGAGNVQYELDNEALAGRVGVTVNARYMVWLELGTRWIAARPWMLATLRNVWNQLVALAGR